MQFRLFSLSYLNWRIFAKLARVVVDRGLTTPVWPIQQQEEEAATAIDSCNPLTLFLYNNQCINISLFCWLLGNNPGYFLYPNTGQEASAWRISVPLATGEALRPKFSSTITLKNNRAFDSIASVYISNIVSALQISAKSCSTVLVASSAAGYLGCAELLEGLKSLFRSITVVVPDLELICENMLMCWKFHRH